jgi:hypothetical protein
MQDAVRVPRRTFAAHGSCAKIKRASEQFFNIEKEMRHEFKRLVFNHDGRFVSPPYFLHFI